MAGTARSGGDQPVRFWVVGLSTRRALARVNSEGRRAAIFAASPDAAGVRGLVLRLVRRWLGIAPGIMRVLLTDPVVGLLTTILYIRVNFSQRSMSALQREMLATVVNGKIGGDP